MKALALNPGSYEGTYKLIGEEISFDFINTVSWPGAEWQHDWLDQPDNFITWALAAGIIDKKQAKSLGARPASRLKKEMEEVRQIRSGLSNVLTPLAFDKHSPELSVKKLDTLVHQAIAYRHIDPLVYKWVWKNPDSLINVLNPVIWNAAHILTGGIEYSRIRHCPSCNWLFYDNTRNRSRKWCDMEDCGSRDKALRYYHRQK